MGWFDWIQSQIKVTGGIKNQPTKTDQKIIVTTPLIYPFNLDGMV